MKTSTFGKRFILGLSFLLLAASGSLHAAGEMDIALLLKAKGDVQIRKSGNGRWMRARRGLRLSSGDRIKTGDRGLAALVFTDDKSMMKIRANSQITIEGKREKNSILKQVSFSLGNIWVKVRKRRGADFRVVTPSGVAAVKGTEWYQSVDENGNSFIIGISGLIQLLTELGIATVSAGETGVLSPGKAPTVTKTPPGQTPNWTNESDGVRELEFELEKQEGSNTQGGRLRIKLQPNDGN